MWKILGLFSTFLLSSLAISAMSIMIWFYDKWEMNDYHNKIYITGNDGQTYIVSDLTPYVTSMGVVIACDLLVFIVSLAGFYYLVKPNPKAAMIYLIVIIVLALFKIVAGAVFYSGVDDNGRYFNDLLQLLWDDSNNTIYRTEKLNPWYIARAYEITSICCFAVFGGLSAFSVFYVRDDKGESLLN